MPKRIQLIAIIFLALVISLFLLIRPYYLFLTDTIKISPLKVLISNNDLKIIDGEVNILILGIAGDNYEGPNLSDSIITANYNFKKNILTTISLPRDIWSSTLKDKINSAYAYGEAKQKGGGFKLAKAEVGAIIHQPIQYAILIDFDEFKKFVDNLGGITINVENSFIDKKYPINGRENDLCYSCRYETISFQKGSIHMNGETALKFVRSRNAEGKEGTDFARNKRQQKIIDAIKKEIIAQIKTYDLNKISHLYILMNKLIKRDITNQQLAIIAKNILLSKNYQQKSIVLSEDLFYVPEYEKYEGKYTLMPINDDFSVIDEYIKSKK